MLATILLFGITARADVKLPSIFGNGMVLQREQPIAVWGWADPNERVSVKLKDQQQQVLAGTDGKWKVTLSAEPAGGPFQLEVQGNNKLTFSDVLIGEVWICSGQSNMGWTVSRSINAEQEIATANYSKIRHVLIPRGTSGVPLDNIVEPTQWKTATPENVGDFTAVGYFYARELYETLGVPIGLINSSWGGTRVETWTSKEALAKDRSLRKAVRAFEAVPVDSVAANKKPNAYPTLLFNAMINPLIPYTIRGVIWYQGEGNATRAYQYRKSFPIMITDWRKQWGLGDFPFYYVQLPGYKASGGNSETGSTWAELRESQDFTRSLPRVGQVITIDIGETNSLHPLNKQDIGKRLAAIAFHDTYGYSAVFSGPIYRMHCIKGSQVIVDFDHVHGGLVTHGGTDVVGFEIAGRDKVFRSAKAIIQGNQVIVTSTEVSKPKAVRYAWADDPRISNLFNREGFPAAPFRTDKWTPITKNVKYELGK